MLEASETNDILNLDEPRSFNEKMQWLKLHDHNPIYTQMADKASAKTYVANVLGNQYMITVQNTIY